MERKRKLSLYCRIFTGKCRALNLIRTALSRHRASRWFMLRSGKKIAVEAAIAVLFAACGLAQTAPTSPDQTERRIDSLLSQMTIEEKIDLLGGVDGFYVRGVPTQGAPRFKKADGPRGGGHTS